MQKRRRPTRNSIKRSLVYPLLGLFLAVSGPVGWLVFTLGGRVFAPPMDFLHLAHSEIERAPWLYLYMLVGSGFLFSVFGYLLGQTEDTLRRHYRRSVSQRRLLSIKNKQLERLSITDRLTGLANYFRLHQVLGIEFKRARRYQSDLCLLLVDIDFFKQINDTHGHIFGDFVLHELGQIFAGNLRETDYVARSGGEEFCFVLTQTSLEDALLFAQRLRETVENHEFQHGEIREKITLSGGVASIHQLHAENRSVDQPQNLLSLADQALYQAKNAGRNQIRTYVVDSESEEVKKIRL